jgi:glycosyltransferase involved in cell wall biosynthesis
MKILAICGSIDLSEPGGSVPVWWQMLKAFHELGVEIIVTPCFGKSFTSPWWRIVPKPFGKIQDSMFFYGLSRGSSASKIFFKYFHDRKWQQHLTNIWKKDQNIDVVLLLSVPSLARVVPSWVKKNFGVPTVYYESDIQKLPKYSLDHKREKHEFPDVFECDAVVSSFEKTSEEFRENGVQNVKTIHFGADPTIFAPIDIKQDIDVFFSGYGALDREDWINRMIAIPSRVLNDAKFVVEGSFNVGMGLSERLHSVSIDRYIHLCSRSKVNLNILRQQFIDAGVLNSRIFELESMGCCVVSNPCESLSQFFEPKKEILIAEDEKEAVEIYRWLIGSPNERAAIGKAGRQRILKEHTYLHRAGEFAELFKDLASK